MRGEIIAASIGLILGIGIGTGVAISTHDAEALQRHMAGPEWQTVEVWAVGYSNGFNDSRDLCIQVLQQQRETMLEQMEPTPPRWNSAETPGIGADRHGATLPGLGSSTLP